MTIRCLLFDLQGTLIDPAALAQQFPGQIGRVLAARFGGAQSAWADARRAITADWDSYYADLDLTGEHGLEHFREGEIRVTRALFRLAAVPEPGMAVLEPLARELPELAGQGCHALYPEVRQVLARLHQAGYILGIASHASSGLARGLLAGGGVLDWFAGPILGPDETGRFQKDAAFYQQSALPPEECLVIDDDPDGVHGARQAGMQALLLCRGAVPPAQSAPVLHPDLTALVQYFDL